MNDFHYNNSELFAENVPVRKIAEKTGTPVHIYSYHTLVKHYRAFEEAFNGYPHLICFALKANSNIALLKLLSREGCGADVVSGGELFFALKSGIPAKKIVYAGVGKTEEEITYALKSHILMLNVESSDELMAIDRIAGKLKIKAPVALRVNPDINASTHPYISTGLKKHKFGIPINKALEFYTLASRLDNLNVIGIHKHIGSQITKVAPFVEALKKVLSLANDLKSRGIEITHINIGGGLGIPYNNEEGLPQPKHLARSIIPLLKLHDFNLIVEPGRAITGNAGILVTKVLYIKQQLKKNFVIVDAGMNDLIRPSLYDAYHHIKPVKKNSRSRMSVDVVGPICESGDFFARDREINRPDHGDFLAIMSTGAYGFTMSSNYNGRLKAAEVLVKGNDFFVIRKREEYKDLIKGISIPDFLK